MAQEEYGYLGLWTGTCGLTNQFDNLNLNLEPMTQFVSVQNRLPTVLSSVSQAYSFNINGVGSDPAAIAHSATVAFTAMPSQAFDFTRGVTPASASVTAGQAASFSLDVNPTAGSFPNNVTFSCSKLPALTTCAFNPVQVGSGAGTPWSPSHLQLLRRFHISRARFWQCFWELFHSVHCCGSRGLGRQANVAELQERLLQSCSWRVRLSHAVVVRREMAEGAEAGPAVPEPQQGRTTSP